MQVYRRLSLPSLLGLIGCSHENLMIIGKRNTWMVNVRSGHRRHYVGTRQFIGLPSRTVNEQQWQRLETFVMRYASKNSIISVSCLHEVDGVA